MKIKIRVKRFNPMEKEGAKPYLQAYTIDATEGMTVLEALLKIADEQDPTLSFRKSCRSAICGSCAMSINGFSRLSCNTQIIPEYKKMGDMLIEPLSNHVPLKDLVVDFSPFWKKIDKVTPYLTPPEGEEETAVAAESEKAIDRSQRCIMCGCCNAECNALEIDENFIAPAALAKAWRFVGDVREGGQYRRLEKLSAEHGMWDCVRCVHCTQYCPKDVMPLKQIEMLRSTAIKSGITDNPGAKHVEAMADSVKRVGRLDEAAMTFKTLGVLRSIGMIPFGVRMEMHGKMPFPILFPKIEKIDEVKKIFEETAGREGEPKEEKKEEK